MTPVQELTDAAKRLSADAAALADPENITAPLKRLAEAAEKSRSRLLGVMAWLPLSHLLRRASSPPARCKFQPRMGICGRSQLGHGSRGNWREFDPEEIKSSIYQLANFPT